MGVYIGGPYTDYSAMQGPCPDGFHVPLNTEWQAVYDILITSFGLDDNRNTIQTYLKMPSAGYRFIYGGAATNQDYYGYYWSCSGASSDAYYLDSSDSHIYPDVQTSRTYGCTLRAFKNTATTPDSSWTTLYQGTGVAGIYHNSSLGLISLSSDGNNWITIADKNVGATRIYNNGDILSEANCGYYYQRGNNYGFPFTGSVTTSSVTVDASSYGPGNYYNSSTFITGSYWDSSNNNNLRGGETGAVQVQKELKNAYIGEYKREPTSDVLAYFPLDNTYGINSYDGQLTLNTSGTGYTFTDNSIIVSSGVYMYTGLIYNMTTYTMFGRIKKGCRLQFSTSNNPTSSSWYGRYITRNSDTNYDLYGCNGSSYTGNSYTTTAGRHSFVAACTSSTSQLYIDGTLVSATNTAVSRNQQTLILRGAYNDNEASKMGISNIKWTAEQALAFHEGTKSDFL